MSTGSDIVLDAQGLGKRYVLGDHTSYRTLRDTFSANLRALNPFKGNMREVNQKDILWALQDLSFAVRRGDILGIIGRNGCGKSTLLKILARVVEPTTGECRIQGRVAALLEVGTGFHPELTGRENVYLNGTLLGLSRDEINTNFDDIVNFSEIERFIDTPVKRYSSGMRVRLAFAVAAQLSPEFLLIDEVLAVGDSAFQKKCLSKMDRIASSGTTILFVSHSAEAIRSFCTHAIWLKDGKKEAEGKSGSVLDEYQSWLDASAQ